jgi:hypothetical protein
VSLVRCVLSMLQDCTLSEEENAKIFAQWPLCQVGMSCQANCPTHVMERSNNDVLTTEEEPTTCDYYCQMNWTLHEKYNTTIHPKSSWRLFPHENRHGMMTDLTKQTTPMVMRVKCTVSTQPLLACWVDQNSNARESNTHHGTRRDWFCESPEAHFTRQADPGHLENWIALNEARILSQVTHHQQHTRTGQRSIEEYFPPII